MSKRPGVLDLYQKPYDPDCPVVCMDEQPVQLVKETRAPMAATKNRPRRVDYEYERAGTEIKTLVVDDKWMVRISAAVQSELDRVLQTLTGRIRELAERYATPLPKLTNDVESLATRVDEQLKKMGASWK